MLDKNQIRAIFIFEFKMIIKQQRQHQQCFWPRNWVRAAWFKKFYKGDESLEDEENSGQPSEGDSDQLRASLELILLKLHEKLPKNSASTILWWFSIWSKWERGKSSITGCLMSWLKIKKWSALSVVFSYSTQQQWTIFQLDCDVRWKVDFIRQPAVTSSVARLRRSSKEFPIAKLVPIKGHGHCLVICCQSDPLQFSEFWQNHYIWEVCSANQWDAWKTTTSTVSICQQKGPSSSQQHPTARHTTNASKIEWIGLRSFASSTIFTWALANQLPLLQASWQLFAEKMLPQPAGGRKCFPRIHQILKHRFLC